MPATTPVATSATSSGDDYATVCAVSLVAWMLVAMSHEGIGHALTALLTGTKSGVLSTMAWSSTGATTRLVAAGGTLVNLMEAGVLWIVLRGWPKASPQTRLFLWAACTFNLFTGTGYFLYSGVTNFGDWAQVVAGLQPHWVWMALLTLVGMAGYFGSVVAMNVAIVRYIGIPRGDRRRMKRLTWNMYFSSVALSVGAGLMNPLGIIVVLESAVAAAAGGNSGLLWMLNYVPKGALPARTEEGVGRSYGWIGAAAVLSLAFIFVLGPGVELHR